MMIFRKAIPRRTFLRGLGKTLALPLLDAMVPAFAVAVDSAAKPIQRLCFVYVPNGIIMEKWTPESDGASFELTPILQPLASFRDRMLIVSGLDHHNADALFPGEEAGGHARASSTFLTCVHSKKTDGADIAAGISIDQMAAKQFGEYTQLASLELALDATDLLGVCENGYSCVFTNTLCWRSATTPLPMESQPRAVFERLFGDADSTGATERLRKIQDDRSVLDSFVEAANRMMATLNSSDRSKLVEYLDAIRDVERRIQKAEEQSAMELPTLERPIGTPDTFKDHAELMFDLQLLAFQTDLTRVVTFMMGREQSNRNYREIGIPDAHHPLTHHSGDPQKIAKVIEINKYHTKTLTYFLDKLRSTPDGAGSLLDHTLVLYGSGISDGNAHTHDKLPVVLLGGTPAQFKGFRHLRYPKGTPMANLYLSILERVGVHTDAVGDSTGRLELL